LSEEKDLLRFLTAGSVDDGKSTLIGRLLYDTRAVFDDQLAAVERDSKRRSSTATAVDLSLLTDGLRAEREQGITIDVAYRYFSTARRKFIIADCPGHEQYTRNMATGASNCDLAIILVDARYGILAQTKRHSFIVSMLGIRHLVVAVNKMDLVDWDRSVFERIKEEFSAFAARLEIAELRFIPMSALQGGNVVEPSESMPWYQGETLLSVLETVHIASDRNLIDLRLPVQYVNRTHLDFRGFAGTIASGVLRKGDEIMALPSGRRSHVRSILTDGEVSEAFAPMAVTVTLEDEIDVSRGDMLVHPANLPRLEQQFEAMIVWMADAPLTAGRPYLIKQTTRQVTAQVSAIHNRIDVNTLHRQPAESLAMNEVGRCTIVVSRPLAFDPYLINRATGSFILIDRQTNGTVGAGMILERQSHLRSLEDHWRSDAALPAVAGRVGSEDRAARMGQQPVTILLTGLVGAGKSTIAFALERQLFNLGHFAYTLDGRRMRQTISRDLGYSVADRSESLRRAIDIASVLNDAGLICVCAFLAPSAEVRAKARATIGADRFIEVHVSAPIDVCRARDTEGMYARADAGELLDFPGVTGEYEAPEQPDLVVDTAHQPVEQSVEALMKLLRDRGVVR
jgi:bifunctional enzyme CysN/CysC